MFVKSVVQHGTEELAEHRDRAYRSMSRIFGATL